MVIKYIDDENEGALVDWDAIEIDKLKKEILEKNVKIKNLNYQTTRLMRRLKLHSKLWREIARHFKDGERISPLLGELLSELDYEVG